MTTTNTPMRNHRETGTSRPVVRAVEVVLPGLVEPTGCRFVPVTRATGSR